MKLLFDEAPELAAARELGADIYEMCVSDSPKWTNVGVPTVGGELTFNSSYDGNCLVNANEGISSTLENEKFSP